MRSLHSFTGSKIFRYHDFTEEEPDMLKNGGEDPPYIVFTEEDYNFKKRKPGAPENPLRYPMPITRQSGSGGGPYCLPLKQKRKNNGANGGERMKRKTISFTVIEDDYRKIKEYAKAKGHGGSTRHRLLPIMPYSST